MTPIMHKITNSYNILKCICFDVIFAMKVLNFIIFQYHFWNIKWKWRMIVKKIQPLQVTAVKKPYPLHRPMKGFAVPFQVIDQALPRFAPPLYSWYMKFISQASGYGFFF